MAKTMYDKILQIVSASNNWRAVFKDHKTGIEDDYPVVCWALVETTEEGETPYVCVRGMLVRQEQDHLIFAEDGQDTMDGHDKFLGFVG